MAAIGGLGEIALRTPNMAAMRRFYADVIGLEVLNDFGDLVFFKIADGYAGHTQALALFDHSIPPDMGDHAYTGVSAAQTSLHHIAFAISASDYDAELQRLRELGLPATTTIHQWVHWRSIYVNDPDGNTVEFVCYDESVK
jgi:catechol 2,3-dioxygenase-like lactoylglutathione lyase family enzyme